MPPDSPENPAEEPPSATPPREPSSRIWIGPQVTGTGPRPDVMRIGRRPDNDIVIADLGVSKAHAELRRSPASHCTIIDLGSHNGTFVNGTRVTEAELNEGDIIAIGHATFRLADGELIEHIDDERPPG